MCDLRSWYLNTFHQFVLTWVLAVILFELVLCSTHDVHRIVLKTHHRKNRDRDYYKYQPGYHRQIRKPIVHAPNEDEWSSHHFHNYRPNHKNESNNAHKRGKSRNHTTVKSPLFNIADIVDFTTMYSEKLPIPIIESTSDNYYRPPNNSLDLYTPTKSKRQNTYFSGKVRQLREKETYKNISKGYEVYEEIIGDISPPPPHNLLVNNNQSLPILTTTISTTTIQNDDGENRIKENISDLSQGSNKTYGKRTKSRRNRGSVKFE